MAIVTVIDGDVDVSIRLCFKRQSGKTKIFVDEGVKMLDESALAENYIVQAVARARGWMKMLDDRVATNLLDVAEKVKIDRAFVSKYIRLATISPRIIQAVMDGSAPNGLSVKKLCAIQADDWDEQEREIGMANDS